MFFNKSAIKIMRPELVLTQSQPAEEYQVCYGVCLCLPFSLDCTCIRLLHRRSITYTWLAAHHTCR
jgi:hypothetical protein